MKLFELLDEIAEERKVEIEWHYHEEDDTMEEFGDEFAEDMEKASPLTFTRIGVLKKN